jgi:hypothetical protein
MLRILEDKGHVKHEQDGPRYVYMPTVGRDNAKRFALNHMLKTFFDGSAEAGDLRVARRHVGEVVGHRTGSARPTYRSGTKDRSIIMAWGFCARPL